MSQPSENGQSEYGVGGQLACATSNWRHWRCDNCGACVRQRNEPLKGHHPERPKNWVQVMTFSKAGQRVTELCDVCALHIQKLMVWDDGESDR